MYVRRQEDRSAFTRAVLVTSAIELFADRGFHATPMEAVVGRAGVTTGAAYHHFRDKRALFQAAFEAVDRALAQRIASAARPAGEPYHQLLAGSLEYLEACSEPAVRRLVLLDGPAVLGPELWRRLDGRFHYRLLRSVLVAAMRAGQLAEQPADPLAHLLLGALTDAGLAVATAEDATRMRAEMGAAFARLLEGLRPAHQRS